MAVNLEQHVMEARIAEEVEYRKNLPGMSSMLGLEAIQCNAEKGQFDSYHLVEPWAENVNGTAHGGIVTAAMDSTMSILCRSYIYPHRAPTTNLNVNFLRPVFVGDKLHVRAELLRRGQNLLWLRALAWVDNPEKPCASAEGTFYEVVPKNK